jgi:uncharacterized membrane protein (DUF4010 family)
MARALAPYFVIPFLVGLAAVGVWLLRAGGGRARREPDTPKNPLQFGPAVQMALTFQLVLFGVAAARTSAGDVGLLVSAAILGVTDVDALTISMVKSAQAGVPEAVAAQAITVGILVNSLFKMALALVVGSRDFRRSVGPALAAMVVAIAVSLRIFG